MAKHRSKTEMEGAAACEGNAAPGTRTSDTRLVSLVRLLARQAAREFITAEAAEGKRDGLPR